MLSIEDLKELPSNYPLSCFATPSRYNFKLDWEKVDELQKNGKALPLERLPSNDPLSCLATSDCYKLKLASLEGIQKEKRCLEFKNMSTKEEREHKAATIVDHFGVPKLLRLISFKNLEI